MLGVTDGDGVHPERASGLVVLDDRASRPTNCRGNHAMSRLSRILMFSLFVATR